ncbi:MAG: hypothetical protein HY964_02710 [Ignavibacteriales bacterium]|nr:hypothetical protein [Ignavibacteriales bacterium]
MQKKHIKTLFLFSALISTLFSSCIMQGIEPIPADKQSFIGKWKSEVGIEIEIFSKGTANIVRLENKTGTEKLDINASDPTNFRVYFPKDSILMLIQPQNIAREYRIDRYPTGLDNKVTMMLNGVTLVKEESK